MKIIELYSKTIATNNSRGQTNFFLTIFMCVLQFYYLHLVTNCQNQCLLKKSHI